jgi:hypothetical protein
LGIVGGLWDAAALTDGESVRGGLFLEENWRRDQQIDRDKYLNISVYY